MIGLVEELFRELRKYQTLLGMQKRLNLNRRRSSLESVCAHHETFNHR